MPTLIFHNGSVCKYISGLDIRFNIHRSPFTIHHSNGRFLTINNQQPTANV
ncbi:MAG: hypothetical protein GY943_07760 [Chloroflexi bacterium]|nr:hypothetical protein [Chloroflexota bacterium]